MTGRAPRQFSREPIRELPVELGAQAWGGALLEVFSKATASRVADRYQSVEAFWEGFAQVRTAGASSHEIDDEATIVRSRLSATSTIEQIADRPNFKTLANVPREIMRQKARIVVELPTHTRREDDDEQSYGAGEESAADPTKVPTRIFGSTGAANGSRVQTLDRNGSVVIANDENHAATVSAKAANIRVHRTERGFLERMHAVVGSEWLRRVFIIFLAAALIGLAASTYYHFADKRSGLPFFGSPAKDGRIVNATNVNLRSDPGGSPLAALPEGSRVRIIEERGAWVRIRVLEWAGTAPENAPDNGWVGVRYVKVD